jgi:hypothetical protein
MFPPNSEPLILQAWWPTMLKAVQVSCCILFIAVGTSLVPKAMPTAMAETAMQTQMITQQAVTQQQVTNNAAEVAALKVTVENSRAEIETVRENMAHSTGLMQGGIAIIGILQGLQMILQTRKKS